MTSRWAINTMLENREEISRTYGNLTANSAAATQRKILALEAQGADFLLANPRSIFSISCGSMKMGGASSICSTPTI